MVCFRHARESFSRVAIHTRETRPATAGLPLVSAAAHDELGDEHYLHTSGPRRCCRERGAPVDAWRFSLGLVNGTKTPIVINLFSNPPLTDANVAVFARVRQGKSFLPR
jgi:hypothetical protein